MYWNGKLLSESLSIKGQRYPNLFSYQLSGLHSYLKCGKFQKTNCYSTFFDLISGKGNTAAVFKNYSKKLANAIIGSKSGKEFYHALRNIDKELKIYKGDIINRIELAEVVSGGVRAEFRVRLCDLISVSMALDKFFNVERIRELTFSFESSKIVSYTKFNVELLFKQISSNLLSLLKELESPTVNNFELMERVTTISILESLLTTTLFTGMTYSFAGNLVWNKSTVDTISLELMKSVQLFDRPVFHQNFFSDNVFKISASEDILNNIFGKILRTADFHFPPIRLMVNFEDENLSNSQKAEILWKIYFEELNSNSFIKDVPEKWKLESINTEKITCFRSGLRFRGAVKSVFNFDNYEQYGSWRNKYYLKLAASWLHRSKNPISSSLLESFLVQAIRDMGIEYVHCPGDDIFDCYPVMRQKINLDDRTDSESMSLILSQNMSDFSYQETVEEVERRDRQEMLVIRNLTSKVKK